MEIENYKERITKKNELHLTALLITLIEELQNTKKAIKIVMEDNKDVNTIIKYYYKGKLDIIDEVLHTIDILI